MAKFGNASLLNIDPDKIQRWEAMSDAEVPDKGKITKHLTK